MPDFAYEKIMLTEWEYVRNQMNLSKIQWEEFIETGQLSHNSIISPEIFSSWIRCKKEGVDPYSNSLKILDPTELEQRLEKSERIINIAAPLLNEMAEGVIGTGFRLDLYDADLYLLARFGRKNENDIPRRQLPLGTSQKEFDCGTSAVNLAALLEKPIQIASYEHYNTLFHKLSCVAVPIRGINSQTVAVVGVDSYCWPLHKHTLSMLIALRKSIENSLHQARQTDHDNLFLKLVNKMGEEINGKFIVVDQVGTVLAVNSNAQLLLSGDRNNIIGYSSETLWGVRNPFLEVLRTQKPIVNRDVIFDIETKSFRLNGTLKPIYSRTGTLECIYGVFKTNDISKNEKNKQHIWSAHHTFDDLIGESDKFNEQIRLAKLTAAMYSNILIQGESGTGKEIFAQAIHNSSLHREGPFIPINCSAIPPGLFESELFGYEGGSFTGSKKEGKPGKFELAIGGTIFLDEINSMPLDMQVKLLRVLQEKSIIRVGGTEQIPINVRIIAATNANLWSMVKNEEFREDLFHRINVVLINIPPLRVRKSDIQMLIIHILKKLSRQIEMEVTIESTAIEELIKYQWPGNVRELENVLERSAVIAKTRNSRIIRREDIMNYQGFHDSNTLNMNNDNIMLGREVYNPKHKNLFEKDKIEWVLRNNNGNISKSSKELKMSRNTLYKRIKEYNI